MFSSDFKNYFKVNQVKIMTFFKICLSYFSSCNNMVIFMEVLFKINICIIYVAFI